MTTGLLRALGRLNSRQRHEELPTNDDCHGAATDIVQGRSSIHIMQHHPADLGFPFRNRHPRRLMDHILRRNRAATSAQAMANAADVVTENIDEVGGYKVGDESVAEIVLEPYEPVGLNSAQSQFADPKPRRPASSPLSCNSDSCAKKYQQQHQVLHDTSSLLSLCNSNLDSDSDNLHMDIASTTQHKPSKKLASRVSVSAQSSGTYADAVNTTLLAVEDTHQPVVVSADGENGASECSPVSAHTLADNDSDGHNACKNKQNHTSELRTTQGSTAPIAAAETLAKQPPTECAQLETVSEENGECVGNVLGATTTSATQDPEFISPMSPSLDQVSERCAAHLGSRNELWCESCSEAICSHCSDNAGRHQTHAVVKLSAAYDDTFEEVEAMQITLVRRLTETRQRNAVLGAALDDMNEMYLQAQEALDQQLSRDAETIEREFKQRQQRLQTRIDACGEWRGGLEETLQTVQLMVEELSPAQLVARRGRILRLLKAAERARPADWKDTCQAQLSAPLEDLVRPNWHYTTLDVPHVLELGRRRGHVRVASGPFTAHGTVWRLEARRSRGRLGEPCLSVTATCVEGGGTSAFAVSVHLVMPASQGKGESEEQSSDSIKIEKQAQQQQHFLRENGPRTWRTQESHEFMVCTLDELQGADVLDSANGGAIVRFGVRAESFKSMALAQDGRILALEQRVEELQKLAERPISQPGSEPSLRQRAIPPPRICRAAEAAVPANGPQPPQSPLGSFRLTVPSKESATKTQQAAFEKKPVPKAQQVMSTHNTRRRANSNQQMPVSVMSGEKPMRASAEDFSPFAKAAMRSSGKHRRALSLTSKLRRQPAIPFPLATERAGSVQSQPLLGDASSTGSETQSADGGDRPGVLRRLSGWVRLTEGRVVQHARRMRKQLAPAESVGLADESDIDGPLDDWTFLNKSPAFALQASQDIDNTESPLAQRSGRRATLWQHSEASRPPALPLPQLLPDESARCGAPDDAEDGFTFDGMADIEREQARVDARALAACTRQQQEQQQSSLHSEDAGTPVSPADHVNGLQGRYKSIVQRIDAIQLIANTVENSRDGFSERTLRRISSELAVLADARRRRVAESSSLGASDIFSSRDILSEVQSPVASGALLGLADEASGVASNCLHTDKGRRSVSMDPEHIRRAVAQAGIGSSVGSAGSGNSGGNSNYGSGVADKMNRDGAPSSGLLTGVDTQRRVSGSSVASTASSSSFSSQRAQLPARFARLGMASSRRNSNAPDLSSSLMPGHGSTSLAPQELTPQATRRGGILKPGRTKREAPVRLHQPPVVSSENAKLAHIDVSTPQGPGRFTEYVASTSARSAGVDDCHDPITLRSGGDNSSYSSGASALATHTADAGATLILPKGSGRSRQVRSARTARKCVRFPEEQRLLETIRLIDPRTAQSIENCAAKNVLGEEEETSQVGGSCVTAAPLSVSSNLAVSSDTPAANSSGSSSDFLNNSLLAGAEINGSFPQQLSDTSADEPFDVDNIFADSPETSSCKSPDKFDTATSLLFDEATDQPVPQSTLDCVPTYKRPPIPPPVHFTSCLEDASKKPADTKNAQGENGIRKVVRCKDAVFFDHAVLSPTLAAMAHEFVISQHNAAENADNDDDSDGALSMSFEDALSEISQQQQQHDIGAMQNPLALSGLGMAMPENNIDYQNLRYEHHTFSHLYNSRGLAVGPNVGSTPSSPSSVCYVAGPTNCSSNPSPSAAEDCVLSSSTNTVYLNSSDTSMFVDAAATHS
ncbi:hypothetical protein COEREDRAFT_15844 [Coemansia reversa NRRL 1564]|uniref:B box-type domain-containing protein n=1 Tax=Coemansia reversa (strain ATCC 12441 / NRRL 1564) TaxID=763665 RepID=A0A2G5B9S7_COERN|nr:hypothetical protein COEREDRAFT_15844 [Coemansia reversa NRRL 1564]|eukprot:PIA15764.1 hypothetical protein COEREDRAFT_15844 [Coemansia reversa NRRL 1564]